MRKAIFVMSMLLTSLCSWGAKANPKPAVFTQPDGTKITVYLHGDEDFSWYTDSLGNILERDGNQFKPISVDSETFFSKAFTTKKANAMRRISIGSNSNPYFPHTGSPKALVILVEFTDCSFTVKNPVQSFTQYLNGDKQTNLGNGEHNNYGSVKSYFKDMSNGKFTPDFVVKGPVKLSKSYTYYGEGDRDTHYEKMIKEACKYVINEENSDLKEFDNDNDGKVDLVYIIYAGYSESFSGNSTNCLWPKSGTFNQTINNVKFNRFGINNEINGTPALWGSNTAPWINGIGLFCHEFSHTLGLPDMYPTNNIKIDNQEMEYWDLMDAGEYTDNGYTPTPYTPWEKEVMGWTSLTSITEAKQYTLGVDQALKITGNDNQYLILHNVQKNGWASKQPGHGMLVYRVDYEKNQVNVTDSPNNTPGAPGMTVVPADGILMCEYLVKDGTHTEAEYKESLKGDPYPGTSNVTEITSVNMNRGIVLEKPIYNIEETAEGLIKFDFLEKTTSGIENGIIMDNNPKDTRIYSIDGRYVGRNKETLPKGLYITDNKKFIKK